MVSLKTGITLAAIAAVILFRNQIGQAFATTGSSLGAGIGEGVGSFFGGIRGGLEQWFPALKTSAASSSLIPYAYAETGGQTSKAYGPDIPGYTQIAPNVYKTTVVSGTGPALTESVQVQVTRAPDVNIAGGQAPNPTDVVITPSNREYSDVKIGSLSVPQAAAQFQAAAAMPSTSSMINELAKAAGFVSSGGGSRTSNTQTSSKPKTGGNTNSQTAQAKAAKSVKAKSIGLTTIGKR